MPITGYAEPDDDDPDFIDLESMSKKEVAEWLESHRKDDGLFPKKNLHFPRKGNIR